MPKTYFAIRHEIKRKKQKDNSNDTHHPDEKKSQIKDTLRSTKRKLKILELFSGCGNLTPLYLEFGEVDQYDKKLKTGDSFRVFHRLIAEGKKFDVVDIDPYGFPSRFFPDIFKLIDDGYLFLTFPKPHINILNALTQTHLIAYYGSPSPTLDEIQQRIALYGLCHWRQVEFIDVVDLGRLWRMALAVKRVSATTYTNTRNR